MCDVHNCRVASAPNDVVVTVVANWDVMALNMSHDNQTT